MIKYSKVVLYCTALYYVVYLTLRILEITLIALNNLTPFT